MCLGLERKYQRKENLAKSEELAKKVFRKYKKKKKGRRWRRRRRRRSLCVFHTTSSKPRSLSAKDRHCSVPSPLYYYYYY